MLVLIDNNVLRGEVAINALGWAEERREALRLKQAEQEATAPDHTEVMMTSLVNAIREVVFLLKILLAIMVLLCAVVTLKK
jgi:uncharacterized membrane protein